MSAPGLARTVLQLELWRRHAHVFRLIVANSAALAAALRENGIPVGAVVANGTQVVRARPMLAAPPTVAFAGRLGEPKGVDVLLEAMTIVCRALPSARLLVLGDGPGRAGIERLIRARSLEEVVTLGGHVPRPALDTLAGRAWVQAVPSRHPEPSANVILEAMMRGTAVVGTRTGGTPEIVRDGVTGLLAAPNDPASLAAALLTVLQDRALAERMGAAARAIALAELSTDRMLDRFEGIYRKLLGVHRPPIVQRHPAPDNPVDEPEAQQPDRQPGDQNADAKRHDDEEQAE